MFYSIITRADFIAEMNGDRYGFSHQGAGVLYGYLTERHNDRTLEEFDPIEINCRFVEYTDEELIFHFRHHLENIDYDASDEEKIDEIINHLDFYIRINDSGFIVGR